MTLAFPKSLISAGNASIAPNGIIGILLAINRLRVEAVKKEMKLKGELTEPVDPVEVAVPVPDHVRAEMGTWESDLDRVDERGKKEDGNEVQGFGVKRRLTAG